MRSGKNKSDSIYSFGNARYKTHMALIMIVTDSKRAVDIRSRSRFHVLVGFTRRSGSIPEIIPFPPYIPNGAASELIRSSNWNNRRQTWADRDSEARSPTGDWSDQCAADEDRICWSPVIRWYWCGCHGDDLVTHSAADDPQPHQTSSLTPPDIQRFYNNNNTKIIIMKKAPRETQTQHAGCNKA